MDELSVCLSYVLYPMSNNLQYAVFNIQHVKNPICQVFDTANVEHVQCPKFYLFSRSTLKKNSMKLQGFEVANFCPS